MSAITHGSASFTAIPKTLKNLKNWCLYDGNKVPFRASDGRPARTTAPDDWATFEECVAALPKHDHLKGVGFVFSAEAGFVGVDLDKAIKPDGSLKDWALKVISLFPAGEAYIELSPSGKGLHIIAHGKKPGPKCRKEIKSKAGESIGELEMYDAGRYFTMTGRLFDENFSKIGQNGKCQAAIDTLYEKALGGVKKAEKNGGAATPPRSVSSTGNPEQLIDIIKGSSQGIKFSKLIDPDPSIATSDYGGDHSRAVYALTGIVAFYTPQFSVMDSLFRASGLNSAKWAPDADASGAKAAGKWARLGEAQFIRQRAEYEAKGNVYDPEGGKTDAKEDFSDATMQADKAKGAAEFERHVEVLLDQALDVRRDLFSGGLHFRDPADGGRWNPVFTRATIGALRGACQVRGKRFKASKLENYLLLYEAMSPRKLLIDVPKWDGEDRISHMAGLMRFAEPAVTAAVFEESLKDWCARAWQKIEAPERVQNRCIILSGSQGIGKDVWIQSMFCGFENYMADLTLAGKFSQENEVAIVMGRSVILFISEFDKTKTLGVETLKDLITKPMFTSVRKYDRDATQSLNRCSVIGAANPEHILRDVTGNRRFLVFKLAGGPGEAIRWEYPTFNREFSLQIISQIRDLGARDYHSSRETEEIMRQIIEEYTPEDSAAELIMEFESAVEDVARKDPMAGDHGLFKLSELENVFDSLSKNWGLPRRTILTQLKAAGCQFRAGDSRYYGSRKIIKGRIRD